MADVTHDTEDRLNALSQAHAYLGYRSMIEHGRDFDVAQRVISEEISRIVAKTVTLSPQDRAESYFDDKPQELSFLDQTFNRVSNWFSARGL